MELRHWGHDVKDGVLTLTLRRPEVRNAIDDVTVKEGLTALHDAEEDRSIRAVVFAGEGKGFCAGADINYMKRVQQLSKWENIRDAELLSEFFYRIYVLPKPVVARVHGAVRGGGAGIVAACDVVLAADTATFAFTEVKLGLVPAVISPYVVRRIGDTHGRYYFVTGRSFDAAEAKRIGLADVVVPEAELDAALEDHLSSLAGNGPRAMAAAKELIRTVGRTTPEEASIIMARMLARIRGEAEAQEGFSAFLEKRKPKWAP